MQSINICKSTIFALPTFLVAKMQNHKWWLLSESPNLHGAPVLPASGHVGNNAGMALFADIDPIHFDDTLSGVKTSSCCHCSCRTQYEKLPISIKMTLMLLIYNPAADYVEYIAFKMRKAIWKNETQLRYINLSTQKNSLNQCTMGKVRIAAMTVLQPWWHWIIGLFQ